MSRNQLSSAQEAYDAFAPIYEEFTVRNDHEAWLGGVLLPQLDRRGLGPGRVLDVGCGTGKAFAPLLARGWEVYGCDVSDRMLAKAAAKHPNVSLRCADATALPAFGFDFDLVLALGDVINYLVEDGDLEQCFSGVGRILASAGFFLFDSNTIGLMREMFKTPVSHWMSQTEWKWCGRGSEIVPGGTFEAELSGQGIQSHIHRQRHWPPEQVQDALTASGLECIAVLGQREEGDAILLSETLDEDRDQKAIYIAARAEKSKRTTGLEPATSSLGSSRSTS